MSASTVLVIQTVIAAGGVVASVTVSAFVSGTRWGQMQGDMRLMADRLAKIEGMFTLRLRDNDEGPRPRQ
jgi:hypothetical protein